METYDLLYVICALLGFLFVNEHFISKELKQNLISERYLRSVLEVMTEDMLKKIEELCFEIYEIERKAKNQSNTDDTSSRCEVVEDG